MALCLACQNVNIPNLIRELPVGHVPDWWAQLGSQSKPRGMVHLHDARQLPVSAAEGCPLCGMIIDAILQYNNPSSPPDVTVPLPSHSKRDMAQFKHHWIKSPIYLRPNYDPIKSAFPEQDVAHSWHVRGFKAFVPVDHGVLTGQIRLFAPRGNSTLISSHMVC